MESDIKLRVRDKRIVVPSDRLVTADEIFGAVKAWAASEEGVVFDMPAWRDEVRDPQSTVRALVLGAGWRLVADRDISVVDGVIRAVDVEGRYASPVANQEFGGVRFKPDHLSEPEVRRTAELVLRFSEDWSVEVSEEGWPVLARKADASDRKHACLALYWFIKRVFLNQFSVMGALAFPIEGSQEDGWRWQTNLWPLNPADLEYLVQGPLRDSEGALLVESDDA